MGSLTSRPKVPQVQQPVFVSVPAVAPSSPPPPPISVSTPVTQSISSAPDSTATAVEGSSEEQTQSKARADNLLRRSRGRLGTVLTGFSGFLSQNAAPSARKSLLGE